MAETGEPGLLTQTWNGRFWAAFPYVTVSDEADMAVLFIPPGTVALGSTSEGVPGRENLERHERLLLSMETGVWNYRYVEAPWPVLLFCPANAWWCVNLTWLAPDEPLGWKVDAVSPLQRTGRGFDSMDLILDILAAPDLESWQYKDENELELAEARGILDSDTANAVRSGLEDAARRIEQQQQPFDLDWLSWRPDPNLSIPELPADLLSLDDQSAQ